MTRTRTARILRRTALGVAGFLVFLFVLGFFVSPDAIPTTELPDTTSVTAPAEGPTEPVAPAEPSLGAEVAEPAPAAVPAERNAADVAWEATYPRVTDAGTWAQYDESAVRMYADRLCDLRAEQGNWSDAERWLGTDDRAAADLGQAVVLSGYCTVS